jgi:hypothetical protein
MPRTLVQYRVSLGLPKLRSPHGSIASFFYARCELVQLWKGERRVINHKRNADLAFRDVLRRPPR